MFILGKRSKAELKGVHPDLVKVVARAISLTTQDFSVHDGIRTVGEQRKLVAKGVSKTMKSRHITGHAVDLVPYINGKLRWEWEPIYHIAKAVRIAAKELEIPIRWGGAWDRRLTDSEGSVEDLVNGYVSRRRNAGKRAFIDGPHFELPRKIYP